MLALIQQLQAMALQHGASLKHPSTLRALSIERNAKQGDFSRGVLAVVVEVYCSIGQSAEGRKAILELGFQPFLEQVEGE